MTCGVGPTSHEGRSHICRTHMDAVGVDAQAGLAMSPNWIHVLSKPASCPPRGQSAPEPLARQTTAKRASVRAWVRAGSASFTSSTVWPPARRPAPRV